MWQSCLPAEKKQLWSNRPEDRYLLDNIVISGKIWRTNWYEKN